jgi:transposase
MKQAKYTINDFNKDFPNDDTCLEWLKNYLYPDGIYCEKCKKITKHYRVSGRTAYACDMCGNHIYPMAGTIFEKSVTPLRLWFYAIFLMSATRCGISAKQIQRETDVTYKTAWRMFKQIRSLLQENPNPVCGEFELDDTYIGGKRPGKRGRGAEHKTPVFGMVERKGSVKAHKTEDLKSATVYPLMKATILPESKVYSDEFTGYKNIKKLGYSHSTINHGLEVWVEGDAHTNTIEGFWSLLKRGINGVYHAVSDKYLQHYINEYAFRYNHRKDDKPLFKTFLSQIAKD